MEGWSEILFWGGYGLGVVTFAVAVEIGRAVIWATVFGIAYCLILDRP